MSLDFGTDPGDIFPRLGKLGKLLNSVNTYRGSTLPPLIDAIGDQYEGNRELVSNLMEDLASLQSGSSGALSDLTQIATNTVISMVQADNPQPQANIEFALTELLRQFKTAQTFNANTVSASVSASGSNHGNGKVVVSLVAPNGLPYQMPIAETVKLTCSFDAQTGSATAGKETFSVTGAAANFDANDFTWPDGSGSSTVVQAISANDDGALLTNGDFEAFTVSNIPDSWSIISGAAGTEIKSTVTAYEGSTALEFDSTGTDPKIAQVYGTDTTGELEPLTVYSVAFWCRADSVPASGTLTMRLYDVSSAAVLNDDAGSPNSATINLNALTTSYVAFSGVFRTPRVLPEISRFEIFATSIPSSRKVYIDQLSFAPMSQLYRGGPWLNVHSGSLDFIKDDFYTIAVANSYESAWNTYLERTFGLNQLDLVFPVNGGGTETILDSLLA